MRGIHWSLVNSGLYSIYWLCHPSLGCLYVFSSFPPRPPPQPQQLLPLTSKPFEQNLRYLAQRMYGSGEMYWMTFPRPWPKVTAVASISKNLLVCAIKWGPLIGSIYKIWQLYCPNHGYYLIRFWRNSVGNLNFDKFSLQISNVFFKVKHYFGHILELVGPINVKQKESASFGYWV